MGREPYEVLFRRHDDNPILAAADWPYPAHTVFNPGATILKDGTTLLLCRVEDRRGHSHLCAARSADGIGGWTIDAEPTMRAEPDKYPEELWGIEDPRITYVDELGRYAIAYTAYTRDGPGVALALTEDFRAFERCGLVMQPDDKDAALLPRRINGSFALIHRPRTASGGAHIWMSFSTDLRNWGAHRLVLVARRGAWWDANHVGLSPPLLETERGWLMLYHGVKRTGAGCLYRVGAALLDLEGGRCLRRGNSWIFGPEAPYERVGDVGYVTFPCGYTVGADGDTINLYYGAADTCVALATGSVRHLLDWLDRHGLPDTDLPT